MKKLQRVNSLPKTDFFLPKSPARNGRKESEFDKMLDAYLTETFEDLETYSLKFPIHGNFLDDGYRDVRLSEFRGDS